MNKRQFIDDLTKRLNHLPKEEIEAAIEYYEEYLNEAGTENEESAIAQLGNTANIAGKIISEFALKEAKPKEVKEKKKMSIIWVVLLAIFASPIALPLAFAFLMIILSLIIVIIAVLFSFGITGVAVAIAGLVTFIIGAIALFIDIPTGIFLLGCGLFMAAIGTILIWLTVYLSKLSYLLIVRIMAKFLKRSGEKNEK